MKKASIIKTIIIILLFLLISVLVLSNIIFNDRLIGRSIDFIVPPVEYLQKNVLKYNFYTWKPTSNAGWRNTFLPTLIPANIILYLPIIFKASSWLVSRYQIILTLVIALFSFYLLANEILKKLKLKKQIKLLAFLTAFFFTFNNYFFCELIYGSTVMYFTFSLIPLLLFAVISYYHKKNKITYFILSLIVLIIISSTLQHLILAYSLLFILAIIYKDYKFILKLILAHFLFNLYWLLPLIFNLAEVQQAEMLFDPSQALKNSTSPLIDYLINKEYFGSRNIYLSALNNKYLSYIWLINAFILLIISLYSLFKIKIFKKQEQKFILGFALIFILSLLFSKGAHPPFSQLVILLYEKIPFFNLFRSLQHYIGFYLISLSILFTFSAGYLIKKSKAWFYFLIILIIINAMPWWLTLDLGTKNLVKLNKIPSYFGQYYLSEGNKKMYELNNLLLDFALFTIPPGFSINYLALPPNDFDFINKKNPIKNQGGDAGLDFGNKRFFTTDRKMPYFKNILDNLEKAIYQSNDAFDKYKNIFAFLNIRYFVLRQDIRPLFSKSAKYFDLEQIKQSLEQSKNLIKEEEKDYIAIYQNNNFLPHFYTPQKLIITNQEPLALLDIVKKPEFKMRSAVIFTKQNQLDDRHELWQYSDKYFYLFDKETKEKKNNLNFSSPDKPDNFTLKYSLQPENQATLSYDQINKEMEISLRLPTNIKINDQTLTNSLYKISEMKTIPDLILKADDAYFKLDNNAKQSIKIKNLTADLQFYQQNKQILLRESFENGLWRDGVFDCTNDKNYDQTLLMKLSNEARQGNFSLELGSGQHTACTSQTFSISLKPNNIYKYSFYYKNSQGNQANFLLNLIGANQNYPHSQIIETQDDQWHYFEIYLQPKELIEKIELFFYAPANNQQKNIINYDQVELIEFKPYGKNFQVDLANDLTLSDSLTLKSENIIEYTDKTIKKNLIYNNSFENDLWRDQVFDCTNDKEKDSKLDMQQANDASEGQYSLELTSYNHVACTSKTFDLNLSPTSIYQYSFDYKTIKGEQAKYLIKLIGQNNNYPFSEILKTNNKEWNHLTTFIEPSENIKAVELFFYTPNSEKNLSVTRYDNLELKEYLPGSIFNYYLHQPQQKAFDTPILEYKKINPTKYIIRVHQAKDNFPLIFSETFHHGWQAYINKFQIANKKSQLTDYQFLNSNEKDQASKKELEGFIKNGWLTIDKTKHIDFVSKNFQDTIQNNNLPSGRIWDTWFKKSIEEKNHFLTNSFANAWFINLEEICQEQNLCHKNADGSYDFQITIEFWPQRLFYLGLFFSATSFISILIYLFFKKNKKN